jgi:beta-N-acetylhexosaminidase
MIRRTGPAALALAAGLVLAGCTDAADDAAPSTTTAPAPTTGTDQGGVTAAPPGRDQETRTAPTASTPTPGATDIAGLPTPEELDRARADVAELSLRQLAGQLVVASYPGTDARAAADLVARHHLAGVITLGDNVPTDPSERLPVLGELTQRVTDAVAADGRDWPAFLGIDQEGGPITRVGAPLQRWPAAMALGAADDPELAEEVAEASGRDLRALGYTVVFAPVADVTSGPDDPTIGARSPGSDPGLVARVAAAQAAGFAAAGVVPVAKHFPGHGSVSSDTHVGTAVQHADLPTLRERDLVPFRQLVTAGLPAVMTAHIVVEALDPAAPATLSPSVLTGLLRDELGFEGLVVTDALNMAAVSEGRGPGEAAVAAVRAGADVLLMPPDPGAAVSALVAAVEAGELDRERLEESAARVVATLRDRAATDPHEPTELPEDLALRAARAAITQLDGECGGPLVGEAIQVVGGTEADRRLLDDVAAAAGLRTGSGDVVALVGAPDYRAGGGGGGAQAARGDVVVALDVPYALADSTAATARLAAYGRDRATMTALVEVLTGRRAAPGRLPVDVGPDHPRGSGCGDRPR